MCPSGRRRRQHPLRPRFLTSVFLAAVRSGAADPLLPPPEVPDGPRADEAERTRLRSSWGAAFDEIRSLASSPTSGRQGRFRGAYSWEGRLAGWAEELREMYNGAVLGEWGDWEPPADGDYPFATFGIPKWGRGADAGGDDAPPAAPGPPVKKAHHGARAGAAAQQQPGEMVANALKIVTPVPVRPAPARPGEAILPHTDLGNPAARIWIVTSAALPWMTGTGVNPLLRAAYLTRNRDTEAGGRVTLLLPWLEKARDRAAVYGDADIFSRREEQAEYIRSWLRDTADMPDAAEKLDIRWYVGWQERLENSVYGMGDITGLIPEDEVDVVVLEEPEHLNWYRAPGEPWTSKFKHVVGIVHTNYFVYALEQPGAIIRAPAIKLLCSWMCRSHCHRIIKLSGTLGTFAPEKELVQNVHGVRNGFLVEGKSLAARLRSGADGQGIFGADAPPKIYFIGKMLWSKGIGALMDLAEFAEESAGLRISIDMYGGGPNRQDAEERARAMGLEMEFHGPVDHVELAGTHKIFINPSESEVLCTTVAEALAMGKFVIVPSHPSNDFFEQFPNCLTYSSEEEFVGNLYYAITHEPEPLSEESSYTLSWEAATERFIAAGCITVSESEAMHKAFEETNEGIEIIFPSLIGDEEQKRQIKTRFCSVRRQYRQFRSNLSEEILQMPLLPPVLRERIVSELGKRLDLDIDAVLSNPKMKFQMSPAEFDKWNLEVFKTVTKGPEGDLVRLMCGGNDVGKQHLYKLNKNLRSAVGLPAPGEDGDGAPPPEEAGVARILRRNRLFAGAGAGGGDGVGTAWPPVRGRGGTGRNAPKMCVGRPGGAGGPLWASMARPRVTTRRSVGQLLL